MFEPGHLHRQQLFATAGITPYELDVRYEVHRDPDEGVLMHFQLNGTIDGKPFSEEFDLHRDLAFNFASALAKATAKHGLPADHGPILAKHAEYDAMFTDIRDKLQVNPGESIDLDHLEKDGF